MFFSPKKLLAGAACLLLAASSVAAEWCEGGPWEDLLVIGNTKGGGRFCATKWSEGTVMTGLEVWANKKGVMGIQFYYSDGSSSPLYGKIDGDRTKRLDWDPAVDTITQVRSWGNGRGQFLGRVEIKTAKGGHLDVGKDTGGQDTFEYNVGSGIMLGAFGTSGDLVDSLGFYFLRSKIDKITMDDIVFDETPEMLNERMEGLETVILDYADHTNGHPEANETFTFGKTETRTVSKKFSTTATHNFGWSHALELSGKILDLGASSTTTLTYGYSNAKTEESVKENSVTLTYSVATMLKPGQRVFCRATAMSGVYNGDYEAKVNIWLEDGTTFSFNKGGSLEQTNWSKASSKCQDKDFEPERRAVKFIS